MSDAAPRAADLPAFDALEAAFQALPVAAAALDGTLKVLHANAALHRLLGPAEVLGQPLQALVRVEDSLIPGPGEQRLRARLASGAPVVLHLASRPGGYAVVVQPSVRDEHEERSQRSLLAFSRDVVAARSEEELVSGMAKLIRELFPGAYYCVRVVDPRTYALTSLYAEGKLRDAARASIAISRSAADKLGLERAALAPERVEVMEEPPLVFTGAVRGICTPLVASGQLFGVLNVEFPPGEVREARDEDRTIIRAANHAAVGLRNSKLFDEVNYVRRYLEQLIEHANALIVVINPERQVLVFNHAMGALSGYAREEVLGREFLQFIPEAERGRFQRKIVGSLRGGPAANFETAIRHAKGHTLRVSFSTAAVRAASGEVEGVIAVGQDLTELKSLEQQVIQAEKLASLGQLAAGVAHEINNPLTTISIYADALVRKLAYPSPQPGRPQTDPGDVDKLRRILEASDRILKLARDLTSYARPSGDETEPLSINDLLEQAVGFCDHILKECEIQVVRRFAPELPPVPAVKSNLVQVFVNLLTNACHAMKPGGTVEVETVPEAGGVEVRISDSGSGISPEHLARIFEPFFTTKAEGKGTGLGLSIVQGIVVKHGGAISVESELGRGTTFRVRLPRADGLEER